MTTQQTRVIHPRLDQCGPTVHDAGPTLIQPWVSECLVFTVYVIKVIRALLTGKSLSYLGLCREVHYVNLPCMVDIYMPLLSLDSEPL